MVKCEQCGVESSEAVTCGICNKAVCRLNCDFSDADGWRLQDIFGQQPPSAVSGALFFLTEKCGRRMNICKPCLKEGTKFLAAIAISIATEAKARAECNTQIDKILVEWRDDLHLRK